MPNRILLASWVRDGRRVGLSPQADGLVLLLALAVDDYRCTEAEPLLVIRDCYPRRKDLRETQIARLLEELETARVLTLYTVRGARYLQLAEGIMQVKYAAKRRKHPSPPSERGQGELPLGPPEEELQLERKILPLVVVVVEGEGESESESEVVVEAESEEPRPRRWGKPASGFGDSGIRLVEKKGNEKRRSDEERRAVGEFAAARDALPDELWERLWDLCGEREMHDSGLAWLARFEFSRETIATVVSDVKGMKSVGSAPAMCQAFWDQSHAAARMKVERRRA